MQLVLQNLDTLGFEKHALDTGILSHFKQQIAELQLKIQKGVQEKTVEMPLQNFLRDTFYRGVAVNKTDDIDLAIFDGNAADAKPVVLFEIKRPDGNKAEMMSAKKPVVKSLCQLVLYYLQQIDSGNTSIQHFIVTDMLDWFVFEEKAFSDFFRKNADVKKLFINWKNKKHTTDIFYTDLKNLLEKHDGKLAGCHFKLADFTPLSTNDKKLALLCKFFAPSYLVKEKTTVDANAINAPFYFELLHILGLSERKDEKGNLVIKRLPKEEERNIGSLMELTIISLETNRLFDRKFKDKDLHGKTYAEQIESVALDLCLTWLNRILFLKLLEAQIAQHSKNRQNRGTYKDLPHHDLFLNSDIIKDFDSLFDLFFQVLALRIPERLPHIQAKFGDIPYLNSSLFEIKENSPEDLLFSINQLSDVIKLPYFKGTNLVDDNQKRRTGEDLTLHYLLDFLGSFNFGIETIDTISKASSAINAAVLGKIFEKLNGYKDGAIFTPAFVTMHMTRYAMRHVVLQKLRDTEGVEIETFKDAQNYLSRKTKTADILRFNALLNSVRLCDPSVGSGHFLVSALNEMIAIKSDLGILADAQGRTLHCTVDIKGDELDIRRNNDAQPFVYSPDDLESQRIQETIFKEKRTIIENCLFGVDINSKSVAICQLRLWIELLKNAFYTRESDFRDLETLPNLDINIFSGNSLVGRYKIKTDGNVIQEAVSKFQRQRHDYFNQNNREKKDALRTDLKALQETIAKKLADRKEVWNDQILKHRTTLIQKYKIQTDDNQAVQGAFDFGDIVQIALTDKELRDVENLKKKIAQLENERQTYEQLCRTAFEWRFQIPDVLGDKAAFVGFDLIVGNPPYIPQEELPPAFKDFATRFFNTGSGMSDILIYFIELGFSLLRPSGVFSMIVSNKFMRAGYGRGLRQFLADYKPLSIIDFGDLPVFKEATAYPAIITFENTKIIETLKFEAEQRNGLQSVVEDIDFQCFNPKTLDFGKKINGRNEEEERTLTDVFEENQIPLSTTALNLEGWNLTSEKEQRLFEKIKKIGQPLSKYVTIKKINKKNQEIVEVEQIYRGILTGANDIFVPKDPSVCERILAENPTFSQIIKPLLEGKDIKRYQMLQTRKQLIFTRRGIDIEEYPSVKNYLLKHKERLEPKPKNWKGDWKGRKEGNYKWYEIQDSIDYYEEFEQPKIFFPGMSSEITAFTFDENGLYGNDNVQMIVSDDKFLLGMLNSKVSHFFLRNVCDFVRGGFARLKIAYVKQLPIPPADAATQSAVSALVNLILSKKTADPHADIRAEEAAIDATMYRLFEITEASEIALLENTAK